MIAFESRSRRSRPLRGLTLAAVLLGSTSLQPVWAQQVADTTLAPITVTATKTAHSLDEVPANVSIIDSEQIEMRSPSKMDDLFRDLPGVEMQGGPRRIGQDINIRGMGGQRVVTTLDGARQNFNAGHKGRFFLDPDLLKQIEVVRGSNSALHGSGAIGGVVAMETKDASDYLDAGQTMGFRTKYGYSSGSNESYYSAGAFGRVGNAFDIVANGSFRNSGTLEQGDSQKLPYSAEDLTDYMLKTTIRPGEFHKLSFSAISFHQDGNTLSNPDANQNTTDAYPVDRVTNMRTYSVNYGFSNPDMPLVNPTVKLYRNVLESTERRLPPLTFRYDYTRLTTDGLDVYNTSRFETGALKHALTFGSEYYQDEQKALRNSVNRPAYPPGKSTVAGYYVQDEITLFPGFTLIPSGRFDTYESKSNVSNPTEESQFSPKLAANWQAIDWLTLYSSYGYGFRAPSLLETYVSGAHLGPQNLFVPNPNLRPESTETAEAGFRTKFNNVLQPKDALNFNATYFYTRADDFIDTVVTITNPATLAGSTTNVNIPKATIHGAEISTQYDAPYYFGSLGYSRIRGENETAHRPLDSIPGDKVVAVIGGKLPEHGLKYGWRSELVAEQDRTSNSAFVPGVASSITPKTGGHAIHGVFVSWLPMPDILQGFRVDAGVENIFDTTYRRHLASQYEEGRDYRISVSYTKGF